MKKKDKILLLESQMNSLYVEKNELWRENQSLKNQLKYMNEQEIINDHSFMKVLMSVTERYRGDKISTFAFFQVIQDFIEKVKKQYENG